ncbi:hypothetical protein [Lyngbya aestuarii]|uniref:hypothetical protein n=1 Tax=Lyngbya aestuarii TaxID=118322 RepID=UPI00403E2F32
MIKQLGLWIDHRKVTNELQKRLEENRLGAKVVGVETVDNLTEPQLAAKIRQHFTQ